MGKENFSFDIVSEVNLQEVDNAVNQAQKELGQRFDFKGITFSLDYNRTEKKLTITAPDDLKLRAITAVLKEKLIKRGVSTKSLLFKDPQAVFGGNLQQVIDLANGIDKEKAKELVSLIKKLGLKVQPQIEGEKVRVISPKKDDLQAVIQHIRVLDFPLALSCTNYR